MNQAAPEIEERIARQRIFESPLLEIGRFEARPDDADFRSSGPPGRFHVVFPYTSVLIRHQGRSGFVTDLNTVTFYNPDDVYFREPVDPSGDRCTWFALAPPLIEEVLMELGWKISADRLEPCLPFRFGPLSIQDLTVQRRLDQSLSADETVDRMAVEVAGLQLFARALAGSASYRTRHAERVSRLGRRARSFRRRIVKRTLLLLADRFDTKLSLQEISREAGCSPFHLSRVFEEEMGIGLTRYRLELRVRRAIDLILTSNLTLSDIAIQVGFASHSHLTAMFKRSTGSLPRDWRTN